MGSGRRVFVTALLLSLAVHLLLAGNARRWWNAPAPEIPFPIEAHLLGGEATPSRQARESRSVRASPTAPPQAEPPPQPEAPPPDQATPAVVEAAPVSEPTLAVTPTAPPSPAPVLAAPEPTPPAPIPPPPRALRALPHQLTLVYQVQAGDGGFTAGRTTYTWLAREGRYSLVGVTEATGITALFVSGKIVQTSEGRITDTGLQPEQFWIAKGDKRQAPVRMDWIQNRLLLPGGGIELPPLTQDLLSFPFHLAMTARDEDGEWRLPVTNGKKLRDYDFSIVGREMVPVGEVPVETLHLQGGRPGEGALDVWLAPGRHWLPLRIRTLDQKGKVLVLSLEQAG
jgi:hypothetical protein